MASGEEPIYSALAKAASTWAGLGRDMGTRGRAWGQQWINERPREIAQPQRQSFYDKPSVKG